MANPKFFKPEFDKLAIEGAIGDPNGLPAYAYIRVSSSGQAEEGRTGLPRQIEHIHEVARERGFRIEWDMVVADDDSGFEFEHRPQLSRLRTEMKKAPRARAVIIEHLDRLSRNADWHQGFLLHEMSKCGIQSVFWKPLGSRVERAVMGAVAQDGMESAKDKMREGRTLKAESGRVTAQIPLYGYQKVDGNGNVSPDARRMTYYGILESEAAAIRYIYEQLAYSNVSTRQLSINLLKMFGPPRRSRSWTHTAIRRFVRNTAYKGAFVANKYRAEIEYVPQKDGSIKKVQRMVERPQEDWIIVPVPPIVSEEMWELANRRLDTNRRTSARHQKYPYLLTGLVRCATCGYALVGQGVHHIDEKTGERRSNRYYACSARWRSAEINPINCPQTPYIRLNDLESAVWRVVCEILLDEQVMMRALETRFRGDQNTQLQNQIAFMEDKIKALHAEDDALYRAYVAGGFDTEEFVEKRQQIKASIVTIKTEIEGRKRLIMTSDQYEAEKERIVQVCDQARKKGLSPNTPFEVKKSILSMVVDSIEVDILAKQFRINGLLPSMMFSIAEQSAC